MREVPTADCANCKHPYAIHRPETTDATVRVKGKDPWHVGSTRLTCRVIGCKGRCLCQGYVAPKRRRRDRTPRTVIGWQ